jgi:Protein of unknown function (DUF2934)
MINKKPATPRVARKTVKTHVVADVSQRAYELYQQRGNEHGHDVEDWLLAEAEAHLGKLHT